MRFMGYMQDLAEVERRAKAVNLTIGKVCAASGVSYKMIWRWQQGASPPRMRNWERAIEQLRAWLDAEEARLKQLLQEAS